MSNNWLYQVSPCVNIVGNGPTYSKWVEPMRYIYDYELVIFEGTEYVVEIEKESILCPPDSYIIIPPGKKHLTRDIGNRPGHRYWVHFDWVYHQPSASPVMTYLPAVPDTECFRISRKLVPTQIFHGKIEHIRLVIENFSRLEDLFNFGDTSEQLVSRGVFFEILLRLLCSARQPLPDKDWGESKNRKNAALASRIRRQLNQLAGQSACEPVMIQKFLEQSGMSYPHQCRVFKSNYGISPLKYVTELRMTRAKCLLRDTHQPVSEIAHILGFYNLGYFSKIFKKSTGYTPREFRRKY